MEFARAREFIEAVTAHNFEAAEALLDPDVQTVTPRGTLRGIAACRQVLQKASGDEQFELEQAEPDFEEITVTSLPGRMRSHAGVKLATWHMSVSLQCA